MQLSGQLCEVLLSRLAPGEEHPLQAGVHGPDQLSELSARHLAPTRRSAQRIAQRVDSKALQHFPRFLSVTPGAADAAPLQAEHSHWASRLSALPLYRGIEVID